MNGHVHVTEVDSIRYEILKNNNCYYFKYQDEIITINLPNSRFNKALRIFLTKESSYNKFMKDVENNNFPIIYINDEPVKNENIIDTKFLSKSYNQVK